MRLRVVAMIRVVTFDAANTLIRLAVPVGQTYAAVARRFGADLDPDRLEQSFIRAWTEAGSLADELGPRADDGRSWWHDLVIATLALAKYRVDPFDPYFDAVYAEFTRPGVWKLVPGAAELLSALTRSGLRLGVVSNFDRRLYAILTNLDVLSRFDHVVISSEVGADKPSPRIFGEALRRFQVDPTEVLHVGDEEEADGVGARAVGISTFVLGKDGDWNALAAHLLTSCPEK
jgi:putative hydrolase of the HAD superfamily